jgi:hypothetical protein
MSKKSTKEREIRALEFIGVALHRISDLLYLRTEKENLEKKNEVRQGNQ